MNPPSRYPSTGPTFSNFLPRPTIVANVKFTQIQSRFVLHGAAIPPQREGEGERKGRKREREKKCHITKIPFQYIRLNLHKSAAGLGRHYRSCTDGRSSLHTKFCRILGKRFANGSLWAWTTGNFHHFQSGQYIQIRHRGKLGA